MKITQNEYYTTTKYLLCLFISVPVLAYDNIHFYRATNLFPEPQLEKKLLGSFDISIAAGSTRTGRNNMNQKVNVLDIYGLHNMHQLGVNVPGKDLSDPRDLILTQLSLVPAQENFGVFSFNSKFSIFELNASYIQNLSHGFFGLAHIPIRKLEIKPICFLDQTPTTGCPNQNEPIWQAFLTSFDSILEKYNLSKAPFDKTGPGDLTILLGWTINYEETEILDYIDATIRAGFLLPTGTTRDEDKIFSIPHGYNGHYGLPFSGELAFGCYEWLTFGLHIETLFFIDKTRNIRMKTAESQSGLIKLAKGCAQINRGTQWMAGTFLKADHVVRGLSLLVAYSFANKNSDEIEPENPFLFDPCIVNSDEMIQGWKMHTVHFLAEYDFTKEHRTFGPRIGFFYNVQVGGKRVFKTNMGGVNFGLEIAIDF